MRSSYSRLGATVAIVVALVAGAPSSAWAAANGGRSKAVVDDPPNEASGKTWGTARNCSMYAGPGGFGMHCATPDTMGPSVIDILKRRKIPKCFYTQAPDDYVGVNRAPEDADKEGTWWLYECLTGVNDDMTAVTGELGFDIIKDLFVAKGKQPEPHLDKGQLGVIDDVATPPYPTVILTPGPVSSSSGDSARPRVNMPTVFWDSNATMVPEIVSRGVHMKAELHSLKLYTEGESNTDAIERCMGGGLRVDPGDVGDQTLLHFLQSLGNQVCWHVYERSSARITGTTSSDKQKYPMKVVAYWTVYYDTGDGWQVFHSFAVDNPTQYIPVAEIQSLVIS